MDDPPVLVIVDIADRIPQWGFDFAVLLAQSNGGVLRNMARADIEHFYDARCNWDGLFCDVCCCHFENLSKMDATSPKGHG